MGATTTPLVSAVITQRRLAKVYFCVANTSRRPSADTLTDAGALYPRSRSILRHLEFTSLEKAFPFAGLAILSLSPVGRPVAINLVLMVGSVGRVDAALVSMIENPRMARTQMDERVEKAVQFMQSNCQRKLHLHQIAEGVGISRSRLSALFLAHLDVSPMRHLKTIRMQQAKALLQSSSLNMKEIAAHAGFHDISHFVRDFSRRYGKSPTMSRIENGLHK